MLMILDGLVAPDPNDEVNHGGSDGDLLTVSNRRKKPTHESFHRHPGGQTSYFAKPR